MTGVVYYKEFEKIVSSLDHRPKLLLHSCCAPCSSYCLVYLLDHFDITCFYYNPNITDKDEYDKRVAELHRLVTAINSEYASSIRIIDGPYEPDVFVSAVEKENLASCPEGGNRCKMCFSMRLMKAYEAARSGGFEYYTTTLTISPLKDAKVINTIGYEIGGQMWLPSDFKKHDGYKQSIELSRKYDLYRQNYCGCDYSKGIRTNF
ncbi:MAG: epoxyqueuosine reductase QueH [Lachnospiraceae bacterium]|nr:epoxyqueuosine reductase QueH [Lachnospiraceae bacterium]